MQGAPAAGAPCLLYKSLSKIHITLLLRALPVSFCSLLSHVATATLALCKQSDFVDDITSKNPSDNPPQNLHHINLDKL